MSQPFKIHFKVENFANNPSVSPSPSSELEDNLYDRFK